MLYNVLNYNILGKSVISAVTGRVWTVKQVNLLFHILSFICFLWGLFAGDSAAAAVGSLPFWVLVCTAVHESGHCLGCALTGKRIPEVRLPLFAISDGAVSLRPAYSPVSYCRFRKDARNWPVYLMGPVISLLLWLLLVLLLRNYPSLTILFGSITAFLVLAVNAIPIRHNDMSMVLRELLFRNENNT